MNPFYAIVSIPLKHAGSLTPGMARGPGTKTLILLPVEPACATRERCL